MSTPDSPVRPPSGGPAAASAQPWVELLAHAPDFVGATDAKGWVTFFNPTARRLLGLASDGPLPQLNIRAFLSEAAALLFEREAIPAALRDGVWRGETRLRAVGGRDFPVSKILTAHRGPDGAVQGFAMLVRDLSPQREAEALSSDALRALRESEQRFAAAFHASPFGIALTALEDGKYLDVNDSYCRLLETTRDEIIGRTSLDLDLWINPEQRREIVSRLQREGRVENFEIFGRTRSGREARALCDARIAQLGGRRCIVSSLRDVSEQRRIEAALHESEERYRKLVENLPEAVVVHNGKDILFVNAAGCAMVGASSPAEILGKSPLNFLHVESRPSAAERMASVLRGGPVTPLVVLRVQHRDGSDIEVESVSVGLTYSGQNCVLVVMRDITQRRQTERALRDSEERFSKAFESSPDAISISRLDNGTFIDVNQTFLRLTGYTRDQVVGHTSLELNIWPNADSRAQIVSELKRTGSVRDVPIAFRMKSGGLLQCSLNAEIAEIAGVRCLIGISRDITERHATQEALRASERKFATAFMASPDAIAISRMDDGRYVEVNEGFERISGYRRDDVIGHNATDLRLWCYPGDHDRMVELLQREGRVRDFEADFRKRDGELIHGLVSAERIELADEPCLVTVVRDITALKRATAALRESEQRHRVLVESAPEAIVVFDLEAGHFTDVNENACKLFECSQEELLTLNPVVLSPPEQPDGRATEVAAKDLLGQALAGKNPVFTWTHRSRKGRDIPCEIRLVRLPAAGRQLVRGSVSDISQRLNLEAQLRQAQKMDSLGRLAGGVAHDFNNILTVVQGHASLLLSHEMLPGPARDSVQQILQSAEFAAGLTRQLLLVGRKQAPQLRAVDLNETIDRMSRLLRRLVGDHLTLEVKPTPGVSAIRADPGMIDQVLLNLVVNARDAIPAAGGRVTLRTGVTEIDAAYVQRVSLARPGRHAWLEVADTGMGIGPDILPHIFDPFFTTKQAGKGTGLGLATVYSIVQQHQGWIEVESVPGFGARFRAYFPAGAATAANATAGAVMATPTAKRIRILAVEDEESVRELLQRMLALLGHDVTALASGEAALALWEKRSADFDVIIADVIMPGGINGREMVERLRVKRPDIPAVFVSGYSADVLDPEVLEQPGNHFLGKPFQVEQLRTMLTRVVG